MTSRIALCLGSMTFIAAALYFLPKERRNSAKEVISGPPAVSKPESGGETNYLEPQRAAIVTEEPKPTLHYNNSEQTSRRPKQKLAWETNGHIEIARQLFQQSASREAWETFAKEKGYTLCDFAANSSQMDYGVVLATRPIDLYVDRRGFQTVRIEELAGIDVVLFSRKQGRDNMLQISRYGEVKMINIK